MEEKIKICRECVDLNIMENTEQTVLRHLTGLMTAQGFVQEVYADKICEREREYPTGLQFPNIAIALPHGDSSYVETSAIAKIPATGPIPTIATKIPKRRSQ